MMEEPKAHFLDGPPVALQKIKKGFGVRDIMAETVMVLNDGAIRGDILPSLEAALVVFNKEKVLFEAFVEGMRG